MKHCPLLPKYSPVFVQLGKFGDIMILLVGMKHIFDETGSKPVMLTSTDYGTILEGVSYVQPWIEPLHWVNDLGRARRMAESRFGWAICPKWWDDPRHLPPPVLNGEKTTTLMFAGRKIEIPAAQWDSYQLSQWRAAGFKTQEMLDWPLVFDRRNMTRELELRKQVFRTNKKKLLVNLVGGGSSRFGFDSEVNSVIGAFRNEFEVVDMARIRAHRIFDLLGLYDAAAGMVTVDTSTLHLAGAHRLPYVAYLANGGGGSIPKGNCTLAMRYHETIKRLDELRQQLQQWSRA
jgi:hypothetical protein